MARPFIPNFVRIRLYKLRRRISKSKATSKKLHSRKAYRQRFGNWRGTLIRFRLANSETGWIKVSVPQSLTPVLLRARTSDIAVFEEVFVDDEYDIPVAVNPGLIVDAGANIGLVTLLFAKKYPGARIIAVEPEPSNIDMLRANTAAYPNVTVVEAGIWHEHGPLQIENPYGSKYAFRLMQSGTADNSIRGLTIGDILDSSDFGVIDILKMDIEGAEKEVLSHSGDWIGRIKILIVELHDRVVPGCTAALYSAMAPYDFDEYRLKTTTTLVNRGLRQPCPESREAANAQTVEVHPSL